MLQGTETRNFLVIRGWLLPTVCNVQKQYWTFLRTNIATFVPYITSTFFYNLDRLSGYLCTVDSIILNNVCMGLSHFVKFSTTRRHSEEIFVNAHRRHHRQKKSMHVKHIDGVLLPFKSLGSCRHYIFNITLYIPMNGVRLWHDNYKCHFDRFYRLIIILFICITFRQI